MTTTTATAAMTGLVELSGRSEELVAEWDRLAERCEASPFLCPGLVLAWAGAFDAGPLTLATVRRDGELVAALPLLRDGRRLRSTGNWHTVETGLLALDGDAARALAATVFEARPRGVALELLHRDDAATLGAAARAAGCRTLEQPMLASPYLDTTDGDFEALVAAWPSKRRSEHRRLRRRLEEQGAVTFERADLADGVGAGFEQLLALEAQGWKAAGGTAIAQQHETSRFYRDVAGWAAERGWLRLDALRLDGRPVAMSMGLEAHGVFYGLKLGYDVSLRKLSPAVLMIDEQVRRGFEQGLRRVELLGEDDDYKRRWCSDTHERVLLRAFAPSLAGRADHAAVAYGRPLAHRVRAAAHTQASRLGERARARTRAARRPAEPAS